MQAVPHRISPTWCNTYLALLPPEVSAVVLEPSLSCRYLSEFAGVVTAKVILSTPVIHIEWFLDIERQTKSPRYSQQNVYMDDEIVSYFDANIDQPWLKVPRRVHNKIVELAATL